MTTHINQSQVVGILSLTVQLILSEISVDDASAVDSLAVERLRGVDHVLQGLHGFGPVPLLPDPGLEARRHVLDFLQLGVENGQLRFLCVVVIEPVGQLYLCKIESFLDSSFPIK